MIDMDGVSKKIEKTKKLMQETKEFLYAQYKAIEMEREKCKLERQKLKNEKKLIKRERELFEQEKKFAEDINMKSMDKVDLNVGGKVIHTSRETLCSVRNSLLSSTFSGNFNLKKNDNGEIFLDRDFKYFSYVISFLRNRKFRLPTEEPTHSAVKNEFEHWGIPIVNPPALLTRPFTLYQTFQHDERSACTGVRLLSRNKVVSFGLNGCIKIWNSTNQECESTLKIDTSHAWFPANGIDGNEHTIVCCGSDERRHGTIWLCDLHTKSILSLHGHTDKVLAVRIVGNTLCSASADHTVKVWQKHHKYYSLTKTLNVHEDKVWSVDADPAQRLVVSGSRDGIIKLCNMVTGEVIRTFTGHAKGVHTVKIHHDQIVSASNDHLIKVWDISTGKCITTMIGHTQKIVGLCVVGNAVVSSGFDKTVRIWNLFDGRCYNIIQHPDKIWTMDATETTIVTGCCDGRVRVYVS